MLPLSSNTKKRPAQQPSLCVYLFTFLPRIFLILSFFGAAFLAGRASRSPNNLSLGIATADSDICSWPPDFRPLPLQEFLDVETLPFSHPLLPADSSTRVYKTKRPGASYGPHREFWDTLADGEWEPTTFRIILSALKAGASEGRGTHFDIGGWVGPTSLFAAHFAKRVVALEPDPRAFNELHANARLNPSLLPRLALHRHCLSNINGPVTMTGPSPMGSSMSRVNGASRIPVSVESEDNWGIKMVTWPAVCSTPASFAERIGLTFDEIALVKIDVEGAEAVILPALMAWLMRSAKLLGRERKPPIFCELHVEFWPDSDSATTVAAALSNYAFAFASRAERPGHTAKDNVLQRFYPQQLLADTGHVCPDKQTFCMVLLVDKVEEWVEELLVVPK
jgi:FkbM family methyltransferase